MMSLSDKNIVYEILKSKSKTVNIPISDLESELHNFASNDKRTFNHEMTADIIILQYKQNREYNFTLTPPPKRITAQVYN